MRKARTTTLVEIAGGVVYTMYESVKQYECTAVHPGKSFTTRFIQGRLKDRLNFPADQKLPEFITYFREPSVSSKLSDSCLSDTDSLAHDDDDRHSANFSSGDEAYETSLVTHEDDGSHSANLSSGDEASGIDALTDYKPQFDLQRKFLSTSFVDSDDDRLCLNSSSGDEASANYLANDDDDRDSANSSGDERGARFLHTNKKSGRKKDKHLYSLEPDDEEFFKIKAEFSKVSLTVTSVERVENDILLGRYNHERDHLLQTRHTGFDLNEQYLYHGTRADKSLVCDEGLDQRLSRKGRFGKGIYFSDNPKKSLHYSKSTDSAEPKLILKCKVMLGDTKVYADGKSDPDLIREPAKENPTNGRKYYDSVMGAPKDCREYVIYDGRRAITEFVIKVQRNIAEGRIAPGKTRLKEDIGPSPIMDQRSAIKGVGQVNFGAGKTAPYYTYKGNTANVSIPHKAYGLTNGTTDDFNLSDIGLAYGLNNGNTEDFSMSHGAFGLTNGTTEDFNLSDIGLAYGLTNGNTEDFSMSLGAFDLTNGTTEDFNMSGISSDLTNRNTEDFREYFNLTDIDYGLTNENTEEFMEGFKLSDIAYGLTNRNTEDFSNDFNLSDVAYGLTNSNTEDFNLSDLAHGLTIGNTEDFNLSDLAHGLNIGNTEDFNLLDTAYGLTNGNTEEFNLLDTEYGLTNGNTDEFNLLDTAYGLTNGNTEDFNLSDIACDLTNRNIEDVGLSDRAYGLTNMSTNTGQCINDLPITTSRTPGQKLHITNTGNGKLKWKRYEVESIAQDEVVNNRKTADGMLRWKRCEVESTGQGHDEVNCRNRGDTDSQKLAKLTIEFNEVTNIKDLDKAKQYILEANMDLDQAIVNYYNSV